jgi:putative membrane protein
MTTVAVIFAALAGLLHLGIFVMEALLFERPAVFTRFGAADAQVAKVQAPVFYNIGFYNLFLGLGALVGAGMLAGSGAITLVVFTGVFMVGAAVVLVTSKPQLARAAFMQALFPAIALIAVAFG